MRPGQVVEEQVVRRRSGVVARLIRRLLVQRDDENLRKDHSMTTWGFASSSTHWRKVQMHRHTVFGIKRCLSVSPTKLAAQLYLCIEREVMPNFYAVRSALRQ